MKKNTSSKSRTVSRKVSRKTRLAARSAAQGREAAAPAASAASLKNNKKAAAPTASRAVVTPVAPGEATPRAGKKAPAPVPARAAVLPVAAAVKSRSSVAPAPGSSAAVKLPAILFEGDFPPAAPATTAAPTGPVGRFELGPLAPPPISPTPTPTPPVTAQAAELPELPESYGTGRLLLTPRDPFWLYAHWDFSFEHLRRFNSRAVDGHLVLRVYQNAVGGLPVAEIRLHPESREWFVNVPVADTAYVADLGYYSAPGRWKSVVQSPVVQTPAAMMSADLTVQFATVPVEAAVQQVIEAVQESAAPVPSPAPAPAFAPTDLPTLSPVPAPAPALAAPVEAPRAELPPAGVELTPVEPSVPAAPLPPAAVESARVALPPIGERVKLPSQVPAARPAMRPPAPTTPAVAATAVPERTEQPVLPSVATPATPPPTAWTPAQERAFGAIIKLVEEVRRTWGGSEELVALIRQQLAETPVPALVPPGPVGPSLPPESPSSASLAAPASASAVPAKSGFWFNVNAELVIYGATEPDAEVTIGGRVIKLRKDGTFGYRFALPDGDFELPVVAVAADRSEGRAADLRFQRRTEYRGEVGAQPQDPALKPPTVENVG